MRRTINLTLLTFLTIFIITRISVNPLIANDLWSIETPTKQTFTILSKETEITPNDPTASPPSLGDLSLENDFEGTHTLSG